MADGVRLVLLRDGSGDEVVAVKECPMCRALVVESSIRAHEEFHAQLRRAG
jgi:hypothetical protein